MDRGAPRDGAISASLQPSFCASLLASLVAEIAGTVAGRGASRRVKLSHCFRPGERGPRDSAPPVSWMQGAPRAWLLVGWAPPVVRLLGAHRLQARDAGRGVPGAPRDAPDERSGRGRRELYRASWVVEESSGSGQVLGLGFDLPWLGALPFHAPGEWASVAEREGRPEGGTRLLGSRALGSSSWRCWAASVPS